MTPFSNNPITFGWKQVIQYMTSVTCDSVQKIIVPMAILNNIKYQNDPICIDKTIASPKKVVNPLNLNVCFDRQSPTLLVHTEIMTLQRVEKFTKAGI